MQIKDFWTVQVDTDQGVPYYKTFSAKQYAERKYQEQVDKLDKGCVTLFQNHDFVKECVKE